MNNIFLARGKRYERLLLLVAASLFSQTSFAQLRLADQPVFTSVSVPGNLALTLSVEFPTAVSVAHPTRTYSSANNYLGYFDPAKCYKYRYVSDAADDNYFYPTRLATNRKCSGEWSGNFLNWASMQTIDPFRWALTGGYRWIDTPELTVLEKAWSGGQGSASSNFPNSTTTGSEIAGATPFTGAASFGTSILGWGNKMRFMAVASGSPSYIGTATHFSGTASLAKLYEVYVRVKVCDSSVGLEADKCVAYGNGHYKPEGLMQKYASKIRYSTFGYLASDDTGNTNLKRDGGVLRAAQRFIGPTQPVPGSSDIPNPLTPEWDSSTGVMTKNPNAADATASSTAAVPIVDSGVMNYLNKFGEINRTVYKRYDPVSELYYAALRYFRNLGNVPAWSSMDGVTDDVRKTMMDGFPVITQWKDPVQYSCQRNFILGIGDVNTHADRNLPGATTGSKEPAMPPEVFADTVNAVDWTNKVGTLQGLTNLGTTLIPSNDAGYLMAGLAYYANTTDIRPDLAGKQTIKTYWLDVLEGGYKTNRQFYLAAKYGGFNPPTTFSVDTATATQFADNKGWWSTTGETIGGQDKPDNFYTANRPDLMVQGLTSAFSSISSQLKAFSTSFSTALPQVASLGVASYSARYDAENWTGDLTASTTSFDADTGKPSLELKWNLASTLTLQAAGTGWNGGRFIVTRNSSTNTGVPFRIANLATDQVTALNTTYVSGDDSTNFLNYLRGDRSQERANATDKTLAYRDRVSLLGDIIGAKARPVGAPAALYSADSNPGYDTFKTTYAGRTPMVYAGANDGMVHAVDGSLTGTTAGKEVWAYIPSALFNGPTSTPSVNGLASLGNPDFSHHNLVDATPLAVDVDFGNTGGSHNAPDWRTVLIGGLGKGGKMIYALDITNPGSVAGEPALTREAKAATKVLWEFTDDDLGFVYGQPIVVKTRKWGWTIVVGSGYNNRDGKGYIFFINPATGARLEKIATVCTACSTSNEAGLAFVNAFVLDLTDGYADAVYAGDLQGQLWRLDVTGTGSYPDPVKFAQLTGSDNQPLPVTSRPLPIVQPGTNRRYITVGTGKLLNESDISNGQPQRFFAILDGSNAAFSTTSDLPKSATFPITVSNLRELTDITSPISLDLSTEVGWYLDLGKLASGPGWRVLADPTSFYGTVAFTATAPSSADACQPGGTSRVYALDLGSGSSMLVNSDGTPKRYYDSLPGVVIDLAYFNVTTSNGVSKPRLIAGSSSSEDKDSIQFRTAPGLGLQRLNWREINVNN